MHASCKLWAWSAAVQHAVESKELHNRIYDADAVDALSAFFVQTLGMVRGSPACSGVKQSAHRIYDADAVDALGVVAAQQQGQVNELLAIQAQFSLEVLCPVFLNVQLIRKNMPAATDLQPQVHGADQQTLMDSMCRPAAGSVYAVRVALLFGPELVKST